MKGKHHLIDPIPGVTFFPAVLYDSASLRDMGVLAW